MSRRRRRREYGALLTVYATGKVGRVDGRSDGNEGDVAVHPHRPGIT
jgi:hypothetical protein